MKKVMGLIVLVLGLALVSNVMAYTTWQEAIDAGIVKWVASPRNFVGARADFTSALGLATNADEKCFAQLQIGHSYFETNDYVQAKIEYTKVLEVVDGSYYHKSFAQLHLGHIYLAEKDIIHAKEAYTKTMNMEKGDPSIKLTAQFYLANTLKGEGDNAGAFVIFKEMLSVKDGDLSLLRRAFNKIFSMQSTQVTDWKAHIDWMTSIAVSIPSTSQEYTDFAGMIISERDKLKKIYGIQ